MLKNKINCNKLERELKCKAVNLMAHIPNGRHGDQVLAPQGKPTPAESSLCKGGDQIHVTGGNQSLERCSPTCQDMFKNYRFSIT